MFAAAGTGDPALDAILPFVNLGAFVLFAGLWLTGKIERGGKAGEASATAQQRLADADAARQREVAALDLRARAAEGERDAFRAELSTLQTWVRDQAVPAINESNRLAAAQLEALARRAPPRRSP